MTARTSKGTVYSATVTKGASQETLEALDALADAVLAEWQSKHPVPEPTP